jgi:hypothetical protein
MSSVRRPRSATCGRRGLVVLELLFVVPVLFVLLIAAVAYGRVLTVRCGVTQAATVAAREAAKGGNVWDVAKAVNGVLAAQGIAISDRRGSGTKVILQDGCGSLSEYGDPGMTYAKPPVIQPDEVLTTVWVKTTAKKIDMKSPVVDSLGGLGSVLHGGDICVSSLVKKY